METTFKQDFVRGIRIGTGILTSLTVGWAGVSFATAAWGALPNASSGSTLSATAWNDAVNQVNGLAGAITVNPGKLGIDNSAPETVLDVKVTDTSNSIRIVNDSSTGLRYP